MILNNDMKDLILEKDIIESWQNEDLLLEAKFLLSIFAFKLHLARREARRGRGG